MLSIYAVTAASSQYYRSFADYENPDILSVLFAISLFVTFYDALKGVCPELYMKTKHKDNKSKQKVSKKVIVMHVSRSKGSALVLAMIFLAIFASLSVGLATVSTRNLQMADTFKKADQSLVAAESGIEIGKYIASTFNPVASTGDIVTLAQANATWDAFVSHAMALRVGNVDISYSTRFIDANGSGDMITSGSYAYSDNAVFELKFYRYDAEPDRMFLLSTGTSDNITRKVQLNFLITRDCSVLDYAIASRGRMIIAGDTTINGDIFSTWYKANWYPPFEMDDESVVNGTLNTVMSAQDLAFYDNQMETLGPDGLPLYDEYGQKVIDPYDAVQGSVEGINYDIPSDLMPGLDEDDYDTSAYRDVCSVLGISASTTIEYFPHYPGSYDQRLDSWNTKFTRYIYQDTTYENIIVAKGTNALFENCVFEGVLYVEADDNASSTSKCNNIRFDNCTFNGVIVTSVPKNNFIQWRHNCLYFTGGATFNNVYTQDVTILAPNFNVNLGNTRQFEENSDSVIKGAVVGGIVDIRGNANIEGTIISMYDTFAHSGGYVTNIGFAEDGGGEGGVPEDVGTIVITPAKDRMLPGGIISNIVIVPDQETYKQVQ